MNCFVLFNDKYQRISKGKFKHDCRSFEYNKNIFYLIELFEHIPRSF